MMIKCDSCTMNDKMLQNYHKVKPQEEKSMKKTFSKIIALTLSFVLTAGMVGCGGGTDTPPAAGDRTVVYYATSNTTAHEQAAYEEAIKTYNETQGVIDGIYVQMRVNPGSIATGLESALRNNYQYDVIQLNDDEFKKLATGGNFFMSLEQYLTEEAKAAMDWDQIPESLLNRFRLNTTRSPEYNNKFMAGAGADLLALPNGSDPQILFYNKALLQAAGINVVSIPESEIDGTGLQPHGYAEYNQEPFAGAVKSKNEAGQDVYKVFNECIGMNWDEQRILARVFTDAGSGKYGFMSEWWFFMGFSVGADCIGWNAETKQYELTLGDKKPGYLALEDVTINGRTYKKGEVLHYEEKAYLYNNASALAEVKDKLHKLPSTYDAIMEFTKLGVPAGKEIDTGIVGVGVAPSTTENRTQKFVDKISPFLIEDFRQIRSFYDVLGSDLGIAAPAQYREYVGGSTYTANGKEYLKVIGEKYNNVEYTGALSVKNGTPLVGEAVTESQAAGLFLPANTKNKNYEEAFKFATWLAGPEGQAIVSKGNKLVPNQTSFGMSDAYSESADRLVSNMWVGAYLAQKADIGDYTYFTSLTWITEWSAMFNKEVRNGTVTFAKFLEQKQAAANTGLKGMNLYIQGR